MDGEDVKPNKEENVKKKNPLLLICNQQNINTINKCWKYITEQWLDDVFMYICLCNNIGTWRFCGAFTCVNQIKEQTNKQMNVAWKTPAESNSFRSLFEVKEGSEPFFQLNAAVLNVWRIIWGTWNWKALNCPNCWKEKVKVDGNTKIQTRHKHQRNDEAVENQTNRIQIFLSGRIKNIKHIKNKSWTHWTNTQVLRSD